jgi:hypothetical protein
VPLKIWCWVSLRSTQPTQVPEKNIYLCQSPSAFICVYLRFKKNQIVILEAFVGWVSYLNPTAQNLVLGFTPDQNLVLGFTPDQNLVLGFTALNPTYPGA